MDHEPAARSDEMTDHHDNLDTAMRGQVARRRLLRGAGLAALVALLATFLWQVSPWRPTPPAPPPVAYARIATTVDVGAIKINGVASPYIAGKYYPLQAGGSLIEISSPDFAHARSCVLYWPVSDASTCDVNDSATTGNHLTINLPFSLDDLAPAIRADLTQQAAAALNAALQNYQAAVPPGAHYNTGITPGSDTPHYALATQSLPAQLLIKPTNGSVVCPSAPCVNFQEGGGAGIDIITSVIWRFLSVDSATRSFSSLMFVSFQFSFQQKQGVWSIGVPAGLGNMDLAAYTRSVLLSATCSSVIAPFLGDATSVSMQIMSQTNAGCAAQINHIDSNGAVTGSEGKVVVSFGALLAGDATAQKNFPTLPRATVVDLAVVTS